MTRAFFVLLLFVLLNPAGRSFAAAGPPANIGDALKAEFVRRFINLIEWPAESPMMKTEETIVGVFGTSSLGAALPALNGKTIKGRTVKVREVTSIAELRQCAIAVINPEGRPESLFRELENRPVLTMGETEDFTKQGGMIRVFEQHNRVQFEINREAARKAGLTISSELLQYAIKAEYVFRFLNLTEWPAGSPMSKAEEITIGVFGNSPLGTALSALDGTMLKGRMIKVKEVTSVEELSRCPVAVISAAEGDHPDEILAQLQGKNILTVSEAEDFAKRGGVIRLFMQRSKVRFEVNPDAARKAGLAISSEILKLARIVRT